MSDAPERCNECGFFDRTKIHSKVGGGECYVTVLHKRIAKLERQHWISVDDELPLDGDVVVVHGGCAHHESSGWYTHMDLGKPRPIKWEVTHWMPLPEPPEGVQSNE